MWKVPIQRNRRLAYIARGRERRGDKLIIYLGNVEGVFLVLHRCMLTNPNIEDGVDIQYHHIFRQEVILTKIEDFFHLQYPFHLLHVSSGCNITTCLSDLPSNSTFLPLFAVFGAQATEAIIKSLNRYMSMISKEVSASKR